MMTTLQRKMPSEFESKDWGLAAFSGKITTLGLFCSQNRKFFGRAYRSNTDDLEVLFDATEV
jgi:hypothetical protein